MAAGDRKAKGKKLAQRSEPAESLSTPGGEDRLAKEIGRRLVAAREGLGYSQHAVHTRSKWHDPEEKGISRSVLSMYETGVNRPGAREIRILCETLKITPNWLLFGSEAPAKALQASMEFLRGDELSISVRLAFAMLALAPEERNSLASLVFALVDRRLGDLKLSALMGMANDVRDDLLKQIHNVVGEQHKDATIVELLTLYVDKVTEGSVSNYGNLRRFPTEAENPDYDPFTDGVPPKRTLK